MTLVAMLKASMMPEQLRPWCAYLHVRTRPEPPILCLVPGGRQPGKAKGGRAGGLGCTRGQHNSVGVGGWGSKLEASSKRPLREPSAASGAYM